MQKRGLGLSLPIIFLFLIVIIVSIAVGYNFSKYKVSQPQQFVHLEKSYDTLGWVHYQNEKYDQAIIEFRKYLQNDPQNYYAHVGMGWSLYRRGAYDDAVLSFEESMKLPEVDTTGIEGYGRVLTKLDRYEEAISQFDIALSLDRSNADLYNGKGTAYYDWDNTPHGYLYDEYGRWEKLEQARQAYLKEIEIFPSSIDGNFGLTLVEYWTARGFEGTNKVSAENYEKAIEYAEKTLELSPDYPEAMRILGYARLFQTKYLPIAERDFDAIKVIFEKAIDTDPQNFQNWEGRGWAYYALGRENKNNYFKAIDDLEKAAELNPEHAALYYMIGKAYYDLRLYHEEGQGYDMAMQNFERALELENNFAEVLAMIGNVLIRQGKSEEALGFFDKALLISDTHSMAHRGMGFAHYNLGNYDKAVENNLKVLEVNPYDAIASEHLGFAYLGQKEYEKAKESFIYSIEELEYFDSHALLGLGISYFNLKNYQSAITNLNQALELGLGSLSGGAYHFLGWAHYELEDYTLSQSNFAKALETESNSRLKVGMAVSTLKLGDRQKAQEHLDDALKITPGLVQVFSAPSVNECFKESQEVTLEIAETCLNT